METHNLIELRQERAAAITEMQRIHGEARDASRDLTGEENAEFGKLEARATEIKNIVDREEALKGLDPISQRQVKGAELAGTSEQRAKAGTEEYRDAFDAYLRNELTADQRQVLREGRTDMVTTASTHGGYVVPQDFEAQVISILANDVAVRRTRASVFTTSDGRDLPVPTQSAFGGAAYLTEGSGNTAVADTGAKVTMKAWTIVSQRNVSFQLLEDSGVDIVSLVAGNIGSDFSNKEDTEFAVGSGSSAVTGFAHAPTTGVTTASGEVSSFTYAELVSLMFSVKPQYRKNGEFVIADGAMHTLVGLVDDNHRPIWQPSLSIAEPDTLLGKPLYPCVSMATPAAGTIGIVFGDWAKGYGIRQDGGMKLLRSDERLIDSLETLFIGYERIDGQPLVGEALKSLVYAAS